MSTKTLTIIKPIYDRLNTIKGTLTYGEVLACLMWSVNREKLILDFKKMRRTKHNQENNGKEIQTIQPTTTSIETLDKYKGEKSYSVLIEYLLDNYDKEQFQTYKGIKEMGK